MKNVAIIISSPSHGSAKGREALDIALSLSDINHVSLFFIGDGVFHLLLNQQTESILMRDYIATLKMLDLYDIDDVYVCNMSLIRRNISQIQLNIKTKNLDTYQISQLLAKQDTVLQF